MSYEAQTKIITGLYEKRIGIIHGTHGTKKRKEKLEGNKRKRKKYISADTILIESCVRQRNLQILIIGNEEI